MSELTWLFLVLTIVAIIGASWTYYRQKHPKH